MLVRTSQIRRINTLLRMYQRDQLWLFCERIAQTLLANLPTASSRKWKKVCARQPGLDDPVASLGVLRPFRVIFTALLYLHYFFFFLLFTF